MSNPKPRSLGRAVALGVATSLLTALPTAAGQSPTIATPRRGSQQVSASFGGPPPPEAPAVISRDTAGHVTVRAIRVAGPIHVDGQLDESEYSSNASISDFIQNDPEEGTPATEKTEVWILFDDDTLYLSARCWESRPDRILA